MKKIQQSFKASVISFFVSGLSFLLVPAINYTKSASINPLSIITGILFWLGLTMGFTLLIITARRCTSLDMKRKAGIITFFSNKEARFADILFFVSAAITLVLTVAKVKSEWATVISIVFLYLSFIAHSFLNGKIYLYIRLNNNKLKKETSKNE